MINVILCDLVSMPFNHKKLKEIIGEGTKTIPVMLETFRIPELSGIEPLMYLGSDTGYDRRQFISHICDPARKGSYDSLMSALTLPGCDINLVFSHYFDEAQLLAALLTIYGYTVYTTRLMNQVNDPNRFITLG